MLIEIPDEFEQHVKSFLDSLIKHRLWIDTVPEFATKEEMVKKIDEYRSLAEGRNQYRSMAVGK